MRWRDQTSFRELSPIFSPIFSLDLANPFTRYLVLILLSLLEILQIAGTHFTLQSEIALFTESFFWSIYLKLSNSPVSIEI